MNSERRQKILAAWRYCQRAKELIEECQNEEEEALSNLPEGLNLSPKADAMQEASDAMGDIIMALDELYWNAEELGIEHLIAKES